MRDDDQHLRQIASHLGVIAKSLETIAFVMEWTAAVLVLRWIFGLAYPYVSTWLATFG